MVALRSVLAVMLLTLVAPLVLAGCGCDADVVAPPGDLVVVEFRGELIAEDGTHFTFETDDGGLHEVVVTGRGWALRTGRSYQVRAFESDGVLRAGLGHRCTIDRIREADGSAVDTSYWGWIERKLVTIVVVAGGALAVVVALWAAARVARSAWYDR